jgi:transmembrane sensor
VSAANKDASQPNIATETAEWLIRLQGVEVSREQQEAFAEWLCRSPVHVEEFLQLTALQGDLARLPEFKNLDVEKLLDDLDLSGADHNIVPFRSPVLDNENPDSPLRAREETPGVRTPRTPQRGGGLRGKKLGFAVAAAVALLALDLGSSGLIHDFSSKQHYRTDIGEQRSLTLADGSQIRLNALSNLSAAVNTTVRELHLTDGEALFRVAKDPARPFRVYTPQATIEAKGTQFNVHVTDGMTVVSLLEGHVLVTPPSGSAPVLLNPGEQISIAGHVTTPPKPQPVDPRAAVAWTQHRLVFEDTPLSEVMSEFNRYSHEPFSIDDPALRDLRITASFDSASTQTFADSLAAAGALRITRRDSGGWLIERK